MQKIGSFLKEERLKKKYSISRLEDETKIKSVFLESLEKEDWSALPDFSGVSGFVKNISNTLEINNETALAFLRRDYPKHEVDLNPKPDISNNFSWTPKFTFFAGLLVIVVLIISYLGFQYAGFVNPPRLLITAPKDGEVIKKTEYEVVGKTDPGATIKVNNQSALVDDSGNFNTEIEVSKDLKEVVVSATSRSGKVTTVSHTIRVEL
ncbi:MAG: helix-turn-helix domain-containing protein [Patescibacteria group bacterium]